MTGSTLINGQLQAQIAVSDRGLAYGQGVFETLLLTGGRLQFLDWHLERLLSGCRRLRMPLDALEEDLRQDLATLVGDGEREGVVKIIVTAGSGGRGYALPQPLQPLRIVQRSALPTWPDGPAEKGIQARWCQTRLAVQPALAGIKHLNRLEQVLARAEWQDPSIREGLLMDSAGRVVEGTMSNLFWVKERVLHTPTLDQCGVAGIVRRWILTVAPSLGLEARVGCYGPEAVETADELFVCNSLIGLWPVVQLEQLRFAAGPVTRALQALLNKEYHPC